MEQIDSESVEMNWGSGYMGIYGFAVKNWVSNGGRMVGDGPGLHMENERCA
jgi:hypothetical protein